MPDTATYFSFTSYSFLPSEKKILFYYETGFADREPLVFTETVMLPDVPDLSNIPSGLVEKFLNDVHLMLGVSYYKLYCPPEIRTKEILSETQAAFWNTVYRKGLGEFAYRNDLDLRGRIRFPHGATEDPCVVDVPRRERALVGVGGGKDSAVAIELLKADKYSCSGFIIETYTSHDIAEKMCEIAGIGAIKIRRMLDQKIFGELPGSYKGHIPISAVYAFLGALAALLYDYRYVIVSNEHSSNFGNVLHHGEMVNHQWSKSAEFERLFGEYLRTNLTPSLAYFSIARPFYEIRIGELFAKYTDYFSHFTGCNRKFRIDEKQRPRNMWCCECPKCAFIFLMLAPFVPRENLIRIFGKNMLEDRALLPLFADVLGFGDMKPFDCVGTFDESQAAIFLLRDSYGDTAIVRSFLPRIQDGEGLVKKVMHTARSLTIPTRFRFCGMKNALILGHGKEGRASESYLRRAYPDIEIGVADEVLGTDYLAAQGAYDISIKTPGIPKGKMYSHYTTATNIFFSRFRGTVIGVTGSKGKSTTASLIHAILLEAGKGARLAGNIGTPMLELLLEGASDKDIAVLELSSYQLDDIEFSPHIAVATNLFPEHMDYHGSEQEYYDAKKNIIRFQKSGDAFVYNDAFGELREWARAAASHAIPFEMLPFNPKIVPLLGEHNVDNVRAAVTVAKLLGVAEATAEIAIRNFKTLPHRLEFVGKFKGIKFYDDAISTTPESTIAALRAIPNVRTIFLGGYDRGYDFSELENEIRSRGVKNVVLFPETGKRMFADRNGLNVLETSSMQEAVAFAFSKTAQNGVALLSCASPSYGLWKNFEEKGNEFQRLISQAASGS